MKRPEQINPESKTALKPFLSKKKGKEK